MATSTNKHIAFLSFALISFILLACNNTKHPGYTYMPDMAYSKAYETYVHHSQDSTNNVTARMPVEGTIPRGYTPYHYPNTNEGYEKAGKEVKNPLKPTESVITEGKALFTIYCTICHGDAGNGDGFIVDNEKFPAVPPSYFHEKILNLPEGKMFHTVTYGKNMMGSHASQLNKEERWKVITYIKLLQKEYLANKK